MYCVLVPFWKENPMNRLSRLVISVALLAALFVIAPNVAGRIPAALAVDAVTEDLVYTANVGSTLNSTARATALQTDGKVLVGGAFSGFLRRMNVDGTADTAFNTNAAAVLTSTVMGVAVQSDGKIVAVGGTQGVAGYVRRLNADGTSDTAFNTTVASYGTTLVWAVVIQTSGKILVGGEFSGYLRRLNTNGSVDTAFNTNVGTQLNAGVTSIAIPPGGTWIIVGGGFTNYLRGFDDTGAALGYFNTAVGTSLNAQVNAVAITSGWKVIVGGGFTSKIKSFTYLGNLDTAWNTNAGTLDGNVLGLAADLGSSDGVIAVGAFTGKIKRFAATGLLTGIIDTSSIDSSIVAVTFPCSQILVAGAFTGKSKRYLVDQGWSWLTTPSDTTKYGNCSTPLNSARTKTLSNGLQETISVTGANTAIWEVDRVFDAATIGGLSGHFFNDQLLNEYGVRINVIGTGCAFATLCTNRGNATISFNRPVTNPIISLAAVGGGWSAGGGNGAGWTEFDLTTPGATLTKISGTNIQVVNDTHIEPTVKNPSIECNTAGNPPTYGQTATAACGSIRVNGTFTSISFSLSINSRVNVASTDPTLTVVDAILMTVNVQEDFGLAPVSYDTPAASHIVGSLQMGAMVTPDQTSLIYPTTNADAVAAGTAIGNVDDGVNVWGTSVNVGLIGDLYTVPVSLSGVTSSAKLCGWIDFNQNGTFDTGERACAADPAAGATTANLTWTVPSDAVPGATYARVRLSFSDVTIPTGKVDSGEVEDYSLTIVIATQATTTTTTVAPGTTAPATTVVSTTVAPNTVAPTTVAPATTVTPNTVASTTVAPAANVAPATTATTLRPTTTTTLPPAPSALPDYSIGAQGATQVLSPLGNDNGGNTEYPLDPSTLKLCGLTEVSPNCTKTTLSVPGEGTYTVNPDGTVQFVPEPNFVGTATPRPYIVRDSFNRPAASTLIPKVVPPPAPIASVDRGTKVQGSTVVLQPWINDNAGTIPAGQTGTVALVPASIRLCGPTDVVPSCNRTALATVDGTYTVDIATGAVAFVHRAGFSGVVTQPVTYQIANNWTGLSGVGISSSVLIPTITPLGKAEVVDQRVTTQPGVAGWLNPTQFGTPAPGATWKISTLQIWNPLSKKWSTSVTTKDGVWTVVRGNVRFMPRDGFIGTASLPFRISDSAGHLVNATLFATIREGFELPATGGSSHAMVILALFLFAIGLEVRRHRRLA